MKRVFPLIVVLITLSVLGILFIQMQWITTAFQVKKDQYEQSQQKALIEARTRISELFLQKRVERTGQYMIDKAGQQYVLQQEFTVNVFSAEELQNIVRQSLLANGIRMPFEYAVTNIFGYAVLSSPGYKDAYLPDAVSVNLVSRNAQEPAKLNIYIAEPKSYLIQRLGWMIAASILFTAIIIWAFALTVRTLFTQKKLSEIKSDFINNMTHELKTPLATISLAVDALTNKKVIGNEDQIRYYSAMIKDENKRMNKQVETILQAARIEREEIQLQRVELDAHDVIRKSAENVALLIQEKHGVLHLHLKAARHKLFADEVHFSNIIFNLLDNAIKYSSDKLRIDIETHSGGGMLSIRVKDNGIGMTKDTQQHIFEKFYRAHTGNLHNVKGFGLGLSYVKAMVVAHGGRIRVESAVGRGSTFSVLLPLAKI